MDKLLRQRGLDPLDLRLLNALTHSGRMTNRQLAQVLGIAEPTCTQRRQRLERMGVILGYTAVIAYEHLASTFRAWFSVRLVNTSVAISEAFQQAIKAESAVAALFTTGGQADILFEARTDNYEAAYALKARLELREDIVADIQMSPILKQVSLAKD